MSGVKLTKKLIDTIPACDRDRFIWDAELKGFGVRVWPSGRKTFVAKYRIGGGRNGATRRFTIGTYGTLTVDEARTAARKVLSAAYPRQHLPGQQGQGGCHAAECHAGHDRGG